MWKPCGTVDSMEPTEKNGAQILRTAPMHP
jgi:hypothetical protein